MDKNFQKPSRPGVKRGGTPLLENQAVKRTISIRAENCVLNDYGPNKCNLDHIKTAQIWGICHMTTIFKIFPNTSS